MKKLKIKPGIFYRNLIIFYCIILLIYCFNTINKLKTQLIETQQTIITNNMINEINTKKEIAVQKQQIAYGATKIIEVEPEIELIEEHKVNTTHTNTFKLTAYCACSKCCGKWADGFTASGTKATQGRTIAVDTKVIPLGTKVIIEGYGEYIAEDTGSAIKGNKIDVYFDNHQEALKFGVKNLEVKW